MMTKWQKLDLLKEIQKTFYKKTVNEKNLKEFDKAIIFLQEEIRKIENEKDTNYLKREGLQALKDRLTDKKMLDFIQDEIDKIDVGYTFTHSPNYEEFKEYKNLLMQAIIKYDKEQNFLEIETVITDFIYKILLKFYPHFNLKLWYNQEYEEIIQLIKEVIKIAKEKETSYDSFLNFASVNILNWVNEIIHWNISSFKNDKDLTYNERKEIISKHLKKKWNAFIKYGYISTWD